MNLRRRLLLALAAVLAVANLWIPMAGAQTTQAPGTDVLLNGGFENGDEYWSVYSYVEDGAEFDLSTEVVRSGDLSFHIKNTQDNDARIVQQISVDPSSYYVCTAFVKTKDVPKTTEEKPAYGATISVMDTTYVSRSVTGTTNWINLTFNFYTDDDQTEVDICFTLGGYSMTNTGEVWFDDISVVKVDKRPSSVFNLTYSGEDSIPSVDHWAGYQMTNHPDAIKWIAFAFVWFVVLAILALTFAETGDINLSDKRITRVFVFAMVGAGLFRVCVGAFVRSFSYDIGLFHYWSWFASSDLFNMYAGTAPEFLDYPPLYMYVLAPLGVLVKICDAAFGEGTVSYFVLKTPSMIADMVTAWMLYRLAKKYLDKKWALFIGVFYVMNPAVWINSSGWAQVDSLFTMLILIELVCLIEKRWAWSGIMFALMVLMKPHGIIFTPAIGLVLLFEIIKNKKVKPMIISVGAGLATVIAISLPFYIRMGFKNPTWLLKLYMGTIDQYNYASFNGFNLFAMLGKNLDSAEDVILGLTCAQWGGIGILFSILLAIVFMIFATRKSSVIAKSAPVLVSLILIVSVFTFAHKMHERYMFAAIMLALLQFILTKDMGYMYLAILFSGLVFVNTYYIYNLNMVWEYCHPHPQDKLVMFFGGVEVVGFILLMAQSVKTAVFNCISKPKSLREYKTEEGEAVHE